MPKYPTWKVNSSENAFGVIGIYSSASMQVHQCKTPLCSELGQKQDLNSIEMIMMGLSD